jgi:glycosyltransferase involved in cell wall biosynthesis
MHLRSLIEMKISVVSPVYKCEACLESLIDRIYVSIKKISPDFEIIFVNDASPDNSWEKLVQLSKIRANVKLINLSRNFGQHAAITAGLANASGEWIVVMDCDLQDLPEEIPNLFEKAQEGYDYVLAERVVRKDSFYKQMTSRIFYKFLSYLTDTKQDTTVANFGIYRRKVIKEVLAMGDQIRFFPLMVKWVGFKGTKLPVQHSNREIGVSSYSLLKLLRLSTDVILSFSDKPLKILVKIGFTISVLAVIFGIYNLIAYLNGKIIVQGYASLILSVWFLSGLLLSMLGLVGLYVGKSFDKVKGRQVFIINEKINFDN